MTRSYAFIVFDTVLSTWMEPFELLKLLAMAPRALEPIDPITYAPFVGLQPLPGNGPKQLLLQGGLGDTAVPVVSMELHARALGIPLVTPAPTSVPFLDEEAAPAASGLTLVDYGIEDQARDWYTVSANTAPHEAVRRFDGTRRQVDLFLRPDGQIEDTCDGPCAELR